MKRQKRNPGHGFTLLELAVAIALGLIVMAALANMFKIGMDSTMLVMKRTETQQNMRAAIDLMVKDISMAGARFVTSPTAVPRLLLSMMRSPT